MTKTGDSVGSLTPPSDYTLLLPEGWFRVRIEPEHRESSVRALVSRQFDGFDNVPHIKRRLRDDLLAQADAAFRRGGIELYLSLQQAGPVTIPASLLITLLPAPSGSERPHQQTIADQLSTDTALDVSIVELAAGTAVRTRRSTGLQDVPVPQGTPGKREEALPSVTLDYQLPVPRSAAYMLLTFSTPLVQIADAMIELFDAVAGSLKWMDGGNTSE